jgi:hypothetical protein
VALTSDQILILGVLLATVAMFLWGRWRHDMVAAGALLACVVAGLVPFADAFTGFGHPAVITVACVLVLSQPIGHQNNHKWRRKAHPALRRDPSDLRASRRPSGSPLLPSARRGHPPRRALLQPVNGRRLERQRQADWPYNGLESVRSGRSTVCAGSSRSPRSSRTSTTSSDRVE